MTVYVVIASPPRGHGEPWVSDVFATLPLATAYAETMQELTDSIVYHAEVYEVRTSLDVVVPDEVIESEPFFEGLRHD
jgi:hypothetical protein